MTQFATIFAPVDASPAIQLSASTWRKRVLPIGDISYQGRQLHFTRSYLQGLVSAFRDKAYDAVPFQLADSQNTHTNDPERTRGTITDMSLEPDGLWVTAEVSLRGQRVLTENPYLGVSARIVEQYSRSDGRHYPAAIQHVLGTLDPRIPGLGAWTPVEMASGSGIVIDLSGYSFAGEPAPATGTLSDRELNELLDAVAEADAEYGTYSAGDELSDGELDALIAAAEAEVDAEDADYASAAQDFSDTFDRSYVTAQARQDAISAAIVQDTMHPARRDEDRMARLMHRAAQGVYDGQQADFTAEAAATEITLANGGFGPCGVTDEYGRCASRFHQLGCSHGVSVDWLASSPPPESYAAALANLYDDAAETGPVADDGTTAFPVPQATIELARDVANWAGLHGDPSADWFTGEMLLPAGPQSVYDALAEPIGYGPPPQQPVSYPGVHELAKGLGLK